MLQKFFYVLSIFLTTLKLSVGGEMNKTPNQIPNKTPHTEETAVFSMGCFWCGESEFRHHDSGELLPGIISLHVGYAGGTAPTPTYKSHEGYKEAVKIVYDPTIISYDALLDIFWRNVDPLNGEGQFCDKGPQYTSAIFFQNEDQKAKALAKKEAAHAKLSQNILTEIIPYTTFYDAEEYHQDYKHKNPVRYKYYRWNCGRDQRLESLWGVEKK